MSTISLRLPESRHRAARNLAREENISINQLITLALAEKVSALAAENYIQKRGARQPKEVLECTGKSSTRRASRAGSSTYTKEQIASAKELIHHFTHQSSHGKANDTILLYRRIWRCQIGRTGKLLKSFCTHNGAAACPC